MSGNFSEAKDSLLNIGSDIYDDFYKKLVSLEELTLLFIVTLLIGFNRHIYQLIIKQQNNLVYTIFEDNDCFAIFDCYAKCRFDQIVLKFEELKPNILAQPLLFNNLIKLNFEFKNNIVREIIKCCSIVSIDYIASIVQENDTEKIQHWIQSNISQGLSAKIDDIDKIVYFREANKMNSILTKTLEFSNRCYSNSVTKINQNIIIKPIKFDKDDTKDFKIMQFDRGNKHSDYDLNMEDVIRNM
jgi:hypothetical protein